MIIIADSGSTKTHWAVATTEGQLVSETISEGINPFHQGEDAIRSILSTVSIADGNILSIHFYGSGLRPEFQPLLIRLLAEHFGTPESIVEAQSDLLGAARSLCGRSQGIACILGTGANSCYYDGQRIVANTPPLGYILGDEGSGAVLGRNLLNALYKGALPKELRDVFEQEMQTNMASIISRVYRQPMANRYLASLSTFISRHILQYPQLSQMVTDSFRLFIRANVAPYRRADLPLSAVGSIAYYYQTELAHAAALEGYRLATVEQAPVYGLLGYHARC